MLLLMDSDCLIKLTKAGLKELVTKHETIVIPEVVRQEVVDRGKERGSSDADIVGKNIATQKIQVAQLKLKPLHRSGDKALIKTFQNGKYNAVATDDRKLIRLLQALNIPFIMPGLILYALRQRSLINRQTAFEGLNRLAEFISEDEYSTVKLLLEEKS